MSPHPPLPAAGEVHVWKLKQEDGEATRLSPAEVERMERYRFANDRHRYCATQSHKRTILSRYLGERPEDLSFTENQQGKPALPGLEFSISHTAGLSLLAVTTRNPVGIDIERIQIPEDLDSLAERIASKAEWAHFLSLSNEDKSNLFFQLWTAKEAFVKALGTGFEMEPHELQTELPSLASISHLGKNRHLLLPFNAGPGYVAHLASKEAFTKVTSFDFPD
ncbi:4'-phosphopantetheinyl transferase superfamily protein [Roseibacillus persicicus]|uniref:4'-phosphopantetheinyl transferase family protein n=1 Tax=Roseibacillus persicicus TaxID=454148 RepID=UPI00398B7997